MERKSNINFHQTFRPEVQYISSILSAADDITEMTVKEISSATGIPNGASSGKVMPHISYAEFMGLVSSEKKDGKISLMRTDLGQLVYNEDPGLQENLTLLLCHAMMLRKNEGAEMWYSSFREIFPLYDTKINKELLIKELNFRYDNKVSVKNLAPFITSYEDMFSSLELLSVSNDDIEFGTILYDKDYLYLYAYILYSYWDEVVPNQNEISSDELETICFRQSFGWNLKEEYDVLEKLSDKGVIRLNRQLMPYTILRLVDKSDLLDKLYSELI